MSLAQLLPLPPPSLPSRDSPAARRYNGKHLWWHDAIIDHMLAHPEWTKREISAELNCTPAIIYMITNSDLFRARFEQRRNEFSRHHDTAVMVGLSRVAERSLDIINQVLEKKRDAIPLAQLADLADKTLNRLGYGVRPAAPPAVQVNVAPTQVAVSADALMEARMALRRIEAAKLIEGGRAAEGGGGSLSQTGGVDLSQIADSDAVVVDVRSEPPPPAGQSSAASGGSVLFLGDCGADAADL